MNVTLEYADTPPSYNSYQRAHWARQARIKRHWQGIFESLLLEVPRDRFSQCAVSAEVRFPTDRRRDAGNYQTPIEKALGDALVNGGWLPDDTHAEFRFDRLTILPKGEPLTRLTLTFGPVARAAA